MSSEASDEVSETFYRYGPVLDEYLRAEHWDTSEWEPPTLDQAVEVLEALREGVDVCYEDFETILLMEKNPACLNLHLLLSAEDSNIIGVFPACVNLLRTHCNEEGNGILDYAYGFLCLRVMSLVVQLAMLGNATARSNFFEPFYLATAELSEGESVHPVLLGHLDQLFEWAKGADSKDRDIIQFGLSYNTETRKVVSLPHSGDCSIPDAEFIVEQLWSARDKFLFASKWATNLFPGWCLMLDMIRALFAAPRLHSSIPMSTWTISDDDRIWVHFMDIATRYSLCSNESEDLRLAVMLQSCPEAAKRAFMDKTSSHPINSLDATLIVLEASNKLKIRTDESMFPSLNAFLYACDHISIENAEKLGGAMFDAYFDKMWFEICRRKEPTKDHYHRLFYSCTTLVHAYTVMVGKYRKKSIFFLNFLSEKMIAVHGRTILLPILTQTLDKTATSMDMFEDQFRTWTSQLTMTLTRLRLKVPADLTASLFPVWYRVYTYFRVSAGTKDAPRQKAEKKYFQGWISAWMSLGLLFGMDHVLRHSILCSYHRCPDPTILLGWKCDGCDDRPYCTRRCQMADWEYLPSPHKINCHRKVVHAYLRPGTI